MNINAILFVIVLLLGLMLGGGDDPNGQKRKWYTITIIVLLILESCLRSVSVGPDTRGYFQNFLSVQSQSWADIFASFRSAYFEGEGKDVGFWLYMKLIQVVSLNFTFFLFISALIFFIPMGMILYRYSSHILQLVFAFSLYVALFNIVALSGLRQQLATGFSFMAFLQLGKKHTWQSVLLIFFGALMHISVLLFLLVPIIYCFIPSKVKTLHAISFATIPFGISFSGQIMSFLASFLANDYYLLYGQSESEGGVYTYIILMELLSLFCFYAIKKKAVVGDSNLCLFYTMLPLATMTIPLISLNGAMIRLGQYFTFYMMLLIPVAVDSLFKNTNRKIVYYSLLLLLIIMSLNNNAFHYYFFWQEPQI